MDDHMVTIACKVVENEKHLYNVMPSCANTTASFRENEQIRVLFQKTTQRDVSRSNNKNI